MGGGIWKNDRVHKTAQEIDDSKEDGHDREKFWDGSVHGVITHELGVGVNCC